MTTVFMVTSGGYSYFELNAVFSTREKAQEYIDTFPDEDHCNGIAEMVMDPAGVEFVQSGRKVFQVVMLRDGNTVKVGAQSASRSDANGSELLQVGHGPIRGIICNLDDALLVHCWATDATHAVKIANEKRVQLIASGEWKPVEGK